MCHSLAKELAATANLEDEENTLLHLPGTPFTRFGHVIENLLYADRVRVCHSRVDDGVTVMNENANPP